MRRTLAGIVFIVLSSAALCQPDANKSTFDIADVHVSPRTEWVKKPVNNLQGGYLNGSRYELRRATMLDLIKTAYAIDADKVYGGPSWLDYDRFEIVAKAPAGTRPEDLRRMLQSLLADRFKLAVKMDTRPMPAYLLTAGKEKPKLKPVDSSDSSGCQNLRPPVPRTTTVQCRGVTMEALAAEIRRRADVASRNIPVVDSTGIEGSWDFDLQYGVAVTTLSTGVTTQEGGTLTEALEKLGLKLELSKAPQQVLVVENVNEQPSANPAGVAAALPPLPAPEFEVASIRPCDGTGPSIAPRLEPGGRVTMTCFPLFTLVGRVFNVDPLSQQIAGRPKWSDASSTKDNVSLVAKAPAGAIPDGATTAQALDILNAMLRAFLIDRYKMVVHYEDRPMDAYTLVAAKPKLTKANPENHTGCTRQNGPGVKPGITCQNITMAQFAEQIPVYDTTMLYPVIDSTGIEGAWDFSMSYNPYSNLIGLLSEARARTGADAPAAAEPAEPSGAITFADAIEKQLGLKLEKHTRPEPVLVIDHMEEKPTDN